MNSLISNQELAIELESYFPKADEINIVSAFFTKPAYDWFSKLLDDSSAEVTIVGRFSPKDFIDGASSLEAIKNAIIAGHNVRLLPNLHAKIYQIDHDTIFTGSANMTGKGLCLVENHNLEACTRVSASLESKQFIQKIINSAVEITISMVDKMDEFLSSQAMVNNEQWPEDLVSTVSELFVSDFPFNKPGCMHEIYQINPCLDFAIVEKNKHQFKLAQYFFKKSKSYCWLKRQLIDNQTGRDLGFGKVSSLIHDALSDDPTPYRQDIKEIQSNLYMYITTYAADEILIYVPGRKSEVLKLIKQGSTNETS